MRPHERQSRIVETVRLQGKAAVDELAERFGTSQETIRRDLTALARDGKLEKVHGGAIPSRYIGEGSFDQRMRLNGLAKHRIARRAYELVSAGDTLLIDTGSTTLVFAETLADVENLTVVTNSVAIARVVASGNRNATVILLGGHFRDDNRQTCGIMAIQQLDDYLGDLAFVTAGAVSAKDGIMDYSMEEAQVARAMLRRARRKIVLVDSSKFDRSAAHVVAGFDRIDALVAERPPGPELQQRLDTAGVTVYC